MSADKEWFVAHPNFSEILQEKLGADTLYNHGINGISISSLSPVNAEYNMSKMADKYEDLDKGDFLVIAGGTNDQQCGVPIGNSDDKTDVSFYGAVYVMFSKINEKYKSKGVKIFVSLPLNKMHPEPSGKGADLESYRVAIENRAKIFGFNVINTRNLAFFPTDEEWRKKYMPDGLHPNNEGHALYAEFLYNEIKKYLGSI